MTTPTSPSMSDDYEEFVDMVLSLSNHPANREPCGTVFMRTLMTTRPAIAQRIKGTLHDPSGRDEVHQNIGDLVKSLWDKISD